MNWDPDWTPKTLAAEIIAAIPTTEVKTASVVGNGRLIQVRVSWTDSSGKRRVGTLSAQAADVRVNPAIPSTQHFIATVFGLHTKTVMTPAPYRLMDKTVELVMEEVGRSPAFADALTRLCRTAGAALAAVAAGKGPERVAKAKRLARATEGLRSWLSEALKAGIKDSELKKIMREEVVRLVHEA